MNTTAFTTQDSLGNLFIVLRFIVGNVTENIHHSVSFQKNFVHTYTIFHRDSIKNERPDLTTMADWWVHRISSSMGAEKDWFEVDKIFQFEDTHPLDYQCLRVRTRIASCLEMWQTEKNCTTDALSAYSLTQLLKKGSITFTPETDTCPETECPWDSFTLYLNETENPPATVTHSTKDRSTPPTFWSFLWSYLGYKDEL